MTTRVAELDLLDPGPPPAVAPDYLDVADLDEDKPTAARGIMFAAVISLPFWALVGFTLYLLL